jgi:pSer/pThr/pTyr-binding forkhead associated (FHA) protein
MWILRTEQSSNGRSLTFRILPGTFKTVGRAARADFIVDAPLVSRIHCRLTATNRGDLHVEDLGSTNGTYVNDRRIRRATLASGDVLRVGRVELTVSHED